MRSTLGNIFEGYKTLNDLTAEQLENWSIKAEQDAQQRKVEDDIDDALQASQQVIPGIPLTKGQVKGIFDSVRNTTKKGISWAKGFFGGEDNED